jgi:hypothetical protein
MTDTDWTNPGIEALMAFLSQAVEKGACVSIMCGNGSRIVGRPRSVREVPADPYGWGWDDGRTKLVISAREGERIYELNNNERVTCYWDDCVSIQPEDVTGVKVVPMAIYEIDE